jgi:hypothetical protein
MNLKDDSATTEKQKPRRKYPKSPPPLRPDQMLQLDNVLKHNAPPKELQSLKSSNSFTLPDVASHFRLQEIIHKVDLQNGLSAWNIDGKQKVIRGLPVQEFIRHKRPHVKPEAPTLPLPPPSRPDWADLIYHPKMSSRIVRPTLRRNNGKRLHPHGFIWGGNDVRQPFFPSGYPWQCIGRVFAYADPYSFKWSWSGTGALVGPNTVLTASHVVPWAANPAMIEFVPAYFNGVSTLGANVSSFVDGASSYDESASPAPAFDFAVLRLQDRLGDILGWFGTKMELETQNGDSSGGDSGGPYFAFWDDGPYIVGADVGGEEEWFFFPFTTEDNNVASAGPAMVQLVQWARDNWG